MSQNEINQDFVTTVLVAETNGEQFPISFDEAWRKAGYSRKNNAKRALLKQLIENEDYTVECSIGSIRSTTVVPGTPEYASLLRTEVIKLSSDGFDHFCMAANTTAGREARKMFIRYKKEYIASLNRQLQASEVEQLERSLEVTRTALQSYPFTLDKLHQVSGIVNKSQVKNAIIRDFIEGRDYIWADEILCVNESTYTILVVSFRSVKGADVSELPEIIRLNTREYFQHQLQKKMNRRVAQVDENQLSLFDS